MPFDASSYSRRVANLNAIPLDHDAAFGRVPQTRRSVRETVALPAPIKTWQARQVDEREFPSGWWIAPALLVGLLGWGLILWLGWSMYDALREAVQRAAETEFKG